MTVIQIKALAKKHGWELVDPHPSRLLFQKDSNLLGVSRKTKIISTEIYHEKTGKMTYLERPYTLELLEAVFHNPRVHTKVGKYKTYDITKKSKIKKLSKPQR